MIKIIKDKDQWDAAINAFKDADVYHTYDYHHISRSEDENPILIYYSEGKNVIVLPLLTRKINQNGYLDATSVYGYAGPLANFDSATFNVTNFDKELSELFHENEIVSVFSRLHPFIDYQPQLLNNLGNIISPGSVVNIDVTQPEELQQQEYNRRLKTYINKSKRRYKVRIAENEDDLKSFVLMYHETMNRVNAKEKYFFDHSYFTRLMNSNSFEKDLLLAIDKESKEIAGGALFIMKNKMVNYHLSGVKEKYLKLNPIKLLLDVARENATNSDYSNFNLGGGVGNKEDSLFKFKSGYSKEVKPFNLWRYIVNVNVYDELVERQIGNQ